MEGASGCPNPRCKSGTESLELEKDARCTREYCGWVHCDWCGMSGPTASSKEEAIEYWNMSISNSGRELLVDLAVMHQHLRSSAEAKCLAILNKWIDRIHPYSGWSAMKQLDAEAQEIIDAESKDPKYE